MLQWCARTDTGIVTACRNVMQGGQIGKMPPQKAAGFVKRIPNRIMKIRAIQFFQFFNRLHCESANAACELHPVRCDGRQGQLTSTSTVESVSTILLIMNKQQDQAGQQILDYTFVLFVLFVVFVCYVMLCYFMLYYVM